MSTQTQLVRPIPGLEVVGRGVYVRQHQPYELKEVLFERRNPEPYYSEETGRSYAVPDGYEVDDSPPMPAGQALSQSLVEESWERFEKQTRLDANLAVSNAPFSIDVNASQTAQLREERDSYYALRTSFIPLWTLYIPDTSTMSDEDFELDIPVPFDHDHRREYARFFERYGSHYVKRAWVGGKATLGFTVEKSSQMTKAEIQAGVQASIIGLGGGGTTTSIERAKERLRSNARCTVFGKGGDELKLAALSSLDDIKYNGWLATVAINPQVIELEAVGIWTLLNDRDRAQALMDAYREETVIAPMRAVFNLDYKINFFEHTYFRTYDMIQGETSKPQRIPERWPDLFGVGFERVDAAFVGRYLVSSEGEDLDRKLFLFNRDKYVRWDVDAQRIDPGYPRAISEGWPGVTLDRVDAAINVAPDVYFFRGNDYIRFNTLTNQADPGYPDLVRKRWVGVTFDRLDAAVYWGNGKIYFFRGDQYIRYDTAMWRADADYPKFLISNYVEDWRFFE